MDRRTDRRTDWQTNWWTYSQPWRTFPLREMRWHIWKQRHHQLERPILSNLLPSRDAVDDSFQHTLHVQTVIIKGYLKSQGQEMICLNLHFIFPCSYHYLVLCQIFRLQVMQLTTISSAQLMCWLSLLWDSRVWKLKSFWLICKTMYDVIRSRLCYSFETKM